MIENLSGLNICYRYSNYRALTHFDPPIVSSITGKFALNEKYVKFWCTNLQLTAENSHYLVWLKSLCSWVKVRQRWVKVRQSTVLCTVEYFFLIGKIGCVLVYKLPNYRALTYFDPAT